MPTLHRKSRVVRHRRRRPELSSASKMLTGLTYDGQTIRRIEKLGGARRRLVFGRGLSKVVDRATVHELAKALGWQQYRHKLEAAPDLKTRRGIIARSLARQMAIKRRTLERYAAGKKVAPRHVAQEIARRMRWLQRASFGSPILGDTPVTSAVPPHHGPAKTFSTIARSGIRYRSVKQGGRWRVIPITRGAA